jgi:hypothetical protein
MSGYSTNREYEKTEKIRRKLMKWNILDRNYISPMFRI